jgi:hypothetical protein
MKHEELNGSYYGAKYVLRQGEKSKIFGIEVDFGERLPERPYSAASWGSGEQCSPDGGWGKAPVLI